MSVSPRPTRAVQESWRSPMRGDRDFDQAMCEHHFVSGPYADSKYTPVITPGELLADRFVIERALGQGAGSRVYLARDQVRSANVALKIVAIGSADSQPAIRRLQQEMRINGRVSDHRHVIRASDLHSASVSGQNLLLLAMEYAEGGSLRDWLNEHRNDVDARRKQGVELFKQICVGVGAIHDAGAIHLDLKPDNLLIADGVVKVGDLGAVRSIRPSQSDTCLVDDGQIAHPGTPIYMSPEHFSAPHPDVLDVRADIYALGVILHEIVHADGRPPFGGGLDRVRELHLNARAPRVTGVGERIAEVIARCLEKTPADRFDTVSDILEALEGGDHGVPIGRVAPEDDETIQLWEDARWCVAAGDYRQGMTLCKRVLEIQPEHGEARRAWEDLTSRMDEAGRIYKEIETQLDHRGLTMVVPLARKAVELFPKHPVGQTILAAVESRAQSFRRCMESGRRAAQAGQWEAAMSYFRRAQELDPYGTGPAQGLEFVCAVRNEVAELRRQIDAAIQNRDRQSAMAFARATDEYVTAAMQVVHQRCPSTEMHDHALG